MSVWELSLGIALAVFALGVIIVILLQEGHEKNMGVITGGADTFFEKNKARSIDRFLARWTKIIAIGFFLLAIAVNVLAYFMNTTSAS